ncbi:S41 family peptidase [Flavihumibacter sp. CACIAM 22H1]|uniref:S41 family peptidase n=1 Tax=Flavihumibacter sp. CACIAM 22H1 TaxID=1812911 RepID=UPI0007A82355|nr:S41 family peptidase [Flavihumibacter sp. CACIAM 22H1]KYP15189.1 MAG: hypothetical protein A1D16_00525 [Flavihumibacter sp. CACIAM 22H1]
MRIFLILVLLQVGYSHSIAQKVVCNCRANLDTLIASAELNYAGYPAKVNAHSSKDYHRMAERIRRMASGLDDPKKCYYLLADYVRFFRDKHFIVSYLPEQDEDSLVVPVNEAGLKKYFSAPNRLALEGIWMSADSSVKVAIRLVQDGLYQGIRLASKSDQFPVGFVYFTIRRQGEKLYVKAYDRFMSTEVPVKQYGNLLQFWNESMFGKIYPSSTNAREQEELARWRTTKGLYYAEPAPDVAYLKIPSFGNNEQEIAALVQANDSAIRSRPYLVLDLRGNSGGSAGWVSLLPYMMTNAIEQPLSYLRVSPNNVKLKLGDLEPFVTAPIPDEYQKYFPPAMLAKYKKAYEELPSTRDDFYPIPGVHFPLEENLKYPRKVALIVDDRCGSSTEYFFYLTRQSAKTIRYGCNTLGMMDYEGMSIPLKMPFNRFIITVPSVKSGWTDSAPIDQTGFQPDVVLKEPYEEWLPVIIKDLKRR